MFHFRDRQYKHIIWDFNGTILNDFQHCFEIINEVLSERNLNPIEEIDYQKNFQFPIRNFYNKIGLEMPAEEFSKHSVEWIAKYVAKADELKPQKHIEACFEHFQQKDLCQFVISAYEDSRLKDAIQRLGLSPYFKGVYGTNNLDAHSKISLAKKFLSEQSHVDLDKCVVIGDTDHDKELADAIGCDCILYYSGHQDVKILEATGLPVIKCYSEIKP